MEPAAGETREREVPRDRRLLRRRGHPRKAEPGGDRALVHDALRREREILRMLDDEQPERARVLEGVPEEPRVFDGRAVVRERDRARRGELHEIGELFPPPSARDRRDREHARAAGRGRAREELGHEARRVDRRLGVRHRADRGEAPANRGTRSGRDRFGLFKARLTQVGVQVDEPR